MPKQSGSRSAKWSDEKLTLIKSLMFEGFSQGQIAQKIGETRNAVIGVVTRNAEFFKDAPRLPPYKPLKPDTERRKFASNPKKYGQPKPPREVVKDPMDLEGLRKLEGSLAQLHPIWKNAVKGDRLFIYYKNETEPTFVFKRYGHGTVWRGHGVYAMALGVIYSWINLQRKS